MTSQIPSHASKSNLLDQKANPEWMRVCKCMLPYLDRPTQKNLAISLKLLELVMVIQLYADENDIEPLPLTRNSSWEKDLLLDIKSNLNPEKAYMVDALMKLGEFKTLLSSGSPIQSKEASSETDIPHPTGGSSTNDVLDKLSPLLDDKQKQMLKMFSSLMGSNQ